MFKNIQKLLDVTEPEFKVYLALTSLGPATSGKVCTHTGIPSSHIYSYLESLTKKGLVTWHQERNRKIFTAIDASTVTTRINDAVEQAQTDTRSFSEHLQKISTVRQQNTQPNVAIYQGISGIITAIDKSLSTLSSGDTYYVLGSPAVASKKLNAFFEQFHKTRIRKKIHFKIIYDIQSVEYARQRALTSFTNVRVASFGTSCETVVFKDTVQIIKLTDKPSVIEIRDEMIASNFMSYFELLWQSSNKPPKKK
jgi:sugar-specific transcriptional regulator TrmB